MHKFSPYKMKILQDLGDDYPDTKNICFSDELNLSVLKRGCQHFTTNRFVFKMVFQKDIPKILRNTILGREFQEAKEQVHFISSEMKLRLSTSVHWTLSFGVTLILEGIKHSQLLLMNSAKNNRSLSKYPQRNVSKHLLGFFIVNLFNVK